MSHFYHGIADKDLFACPKCGHRTFIRIQMGYEQHVPCRLLADGKVAVCHYDDEVLEEMNDGSDYYRYIECAHCGHELNTHDLNDEDTKDEDFIEIGDIDCVSTEEVTERLVKEHGAKAET